MNTEDTAQADLVTIPSIGEIVRKTQDDYVSGTTQISKYVQFSMYETLEKITAYLNQKHISGDKDARGNLKPFFDIGTSATNIWFRATDIDRSNIKVRAPGSKQWINSFLATIHLQDWMRRARFGQFLNEWGRSLSRYGSSVIKFVKLELLNIAVIPWNTLIVDAVDFENNPKIELLELTEAQLYERVTSNGYDKTQVDALVAAAKSARETLDRRKKDTKSNYYKLFEIHGKLSEYHLTGKIEDKDNFVQQMHVISFVGVKEGRKTDYQDFTLYKGREEKDPYMITHLIREDGRTLAIGAIEHIFTPQWMVNHSVKQMKDQGEIASKLLFQTADGKFLGHNVISDLENGDVFVHNMNMPLTKVDNIGHDMVGAQNSAMMWKGLANEINGISEAMLGAAPKSGTAWRQTEALLQESYSLFEIMTENKGLHITDMMTNWILPYVKTQMDTSDEVAATLSSHDIQRIDAMWLKRQSIKAANGKLKRQVIEGTLPTQESQDVITEKEKASMADDLRTLGGQRFFKPDELTDKTWKEQFKDLEWEVEVDVTGEGQNVQEMLTTLNTMLKLIMIPGFDQNPRAQFIVGRILELAGAVSPVEYASLPPAPPPVVPTDQQQQTPQLPGGDTIPA